MVDNLIGEIRRSAVLMSYGPGAIIDMRADGGPVSVVSSGLEAWDISAPLLGNIRNQKIIERRLCKKLDKKYFRLPPVIPEGALKPNSQYPDTSALLGKRFPEWLQCPSCDLLQPYFIWASEPGKAYRFCPACSSKQAGKKKVYVVPVRFIVCCTSGHLDDFPWGYWVPHKKTCEKKDKYKIRSVGPGLAGLIVSCLGCDAKRSMDGAFRKSALIGQTCRGKRPWLQSDDPSCDCNGEAGSLRVVQRGASNLFYPVIESALDIPPWTRNLERVIGDYWDDLAEIQSLEDRERYISLNPRLKRTLDRQNYSARVVAEHFEKMKGWMENLNPSELRLDEYRVFSAGGEEQDDEFEIYPESIAIELQPYFQRVLRVARLREVRVLKGFTRINPPFDDDGSPISPLSQEPLDWLPAIEVRGEGVFIQLNSNKLLEWESSPEVQRRVENASNSWHREIQSRFPGKDQPFKVTPRFMLVHTLSHTLIRQLTLECGYSTASIRERLYISDNDDMAGILIYTATADSDGTLGGLQRAAREDLFIRTLIGAIKAIQWCSSDPLCINGEMSGLEAHSIASCHACAMTPETSCELHNKFLDRGLLIGSAEDSVEGFFEGLINK
jgi:hypothetical protein